MQTFTFLSQGGNRVTVRATNERQARIDAMEKLYGPINRQPDWMGRTYLGIGLMLQ